jgi:hypothetical protein
MDPEAHHVVTAKDIHLIVNEIANNVFNIRRNREDELHLFVLNTVTSVLEAHGYNVYSEYPITHSHYYLKQDWTMNKNGYMDLMAINKEHRIAIEFDTDGILKKKSIEKLVESNTEYSIGISYGGSFRPSLGFATKDKIRDVLSHAVKTECPKKMWFIIIVRKILEEVDLPTP